MTDTQHSERLAMAQRAMAQLNNELQTNRAEISKVLALTTETPSRTPSGLTQRTWFGVGYQAALADIRDALDRDGEQGVAEWLRNNLRGAA